MSKPDFSAKFVNKNSAIYKWTIVFTRVQVYFSWNREKTLGLFSPNNTQLHVFIFLSYFGDVNFYDIIIINIDYNYINIGLLYSWGILIYFRWNNWSTPFLEV